MATKRFVRTKEDFICAHCGFGVKGTGYTNHCPKCLWSKHVDVNPGDRAASCGGMMPPVHVESEKGEYIIIHRCELCGHEKRNKTAGSDDFEKILKL